MHQAVLSRPIESAMRRSEARDIAEECISQDCPTNRLDNRAMQRPEASDIANGCYSNVEARGVWHCDRVHLREPSLPGRQGILRNLHGVHDRLY